MIFDSGVLVKKLEGIRGRIYDNDYRVFIGIKTYQILSLKTTLASLENIQVFFRSHVHEYKLLYQKKKCILILYHIVS